MELIADIIVELLFACGIVVIQWCIRHKHVANYGPQTGGEALIPCISRLGASF